MKFYQLKIDTFLKAKIHFQDSPQAISKLIATNLIKNGNLEHFGTGVKGYVFSNLGVATDGYFRDYGSFYLRSFKEEIIFAMLKSIGFEDKIFKIDNISIREINFSKTKAFITQNPAIITTREERFWTMQESKGLSELIDALHNNLEKKYKTIFGKDLNNCANFIKTIQIKNQKPLTYRYKNIKLFANKFFIEPKDDELSQKLAFVALALGIGEKNATVGAGFCKKLA